MSVYPTPERVGRYAPSLEQALERHQQTLAYFAEVGRPLTPERIAGRVPQARRLVAQANELDLAWPDRDTAVPVSPSVRFRSYFVRDSEKADYNFSHEVFQGVTTRKTQRGFNNFYALLANEPFRPDIDGNQGSRTTSLMALHYAARPYLHRAYVLQPDFMTALQKEVAARGGMEEWQYAMVNGGYDPEDNPRDAVLLRGSRLAYGLFANLMRTDDTQREHRWFGRPEGSHVIRDPETELYS